MKHQGQTMSETISMMTLGVAVIRWSFRLGAAGFGRVWETSRGIIASSPWNFKQDGAC